MRKKVLTIDDSENILEMVSMLSNHKDYIVITATTAAEGLEMAKKEKPHLIILDLGLPDLDGYKVCKILKNNKKTKNIPVLVLTGKSTFKDVEQGFEVDADAYLLKPFEGPRLLNKIEELL